LDGNNVLSFDELVQFFAAYRRRQGFTDAEFEEFKLSFNSFSEDDSTGIKRLAFNHFLIEAFEQVWGGQILEVAERFLARLLEGTGNLGRRLDGVPRGMCFNEFLSIARKVRDAYFCAFGMQLLPETQETIKETSESGEEEAEAEAEEEDSDGEKVEVPPYDRPGGFRDMARLVGMTLFDVLAKLDSHLFSEADAVEHLGGLEINLRRRVCDQIFGEVTDEDTWDIERKLDFAEYADFVFRLRQREGLTLEELDKMKNVFVLIDMDKSGEISLEELLSAFEDLGYHSGKWEIQDIFVAVDADNSGQLNVREYLRVVRIHREKDLARIQKKFSKFAKGSTNPVMAAGSLEEAVETLGYDVQGMIEPQAPTLNFDDFVSIVDAQRAISVQLRVHETGLPEDTVARFAELFSAYLTPEQQNSDQGLTLNPNSFAELLKEFGRDPKTKEGQVYLLGAFLHAQAFGSKARQMTIHSIPEEELQKGIPKAITFETFLCLMELFENELKHEQAKDVDLQIHEYKLLERDVVAFEKIFTYWAQAPDIWLCQVKRMPGGMNSPGMFRKTIHSKCLWKFIEEIWGEAHVDDEKKALQLKPRDKQPLERMIASVAHDNNLEWSGFLKVMCWIVETDYASISCIEDKTLLPTVATRGNARRAAQHSSEELSSLAKVQEANLAAEAAAKAAAEAAAEQARLEADQDAMQREDRLGREVRAQENRDSSQGLPTGSEVTTPAIAQLVVNVELRLWKRFADGEAKRMAAAAKVADRIVEKAKSRITAREEWRVRAEAEAAAAAVEAAKAAEAANAAAAKKEEAAEKRKQALAARDAKNKEKLAKANAQKGKR